MENKLKEILIFLVATNLYLPLYSHSQTCENYQYKNGIELNDTPEGLKITSTASAPITSDDMDIIIEARKEAELEAKASISKFMIEDIKSENTLNKIIDTVRVISFNNKESTFKEIIQQLTKISSNSKSILRGIYNVSDCYSRKKQVKVTLGINPISIEHSGNFANPINNNIYNDGNSSEIKPLQGVDVNQYKANQ